MWAGTRVEGLPILVPALQGASVSAGRTVSTCAAPDVQSVMTFFLPVNADTGRASPARELGVKGDHHV